jgi:hypothetical protein
MALKQYRVSIMRVLILDDGSILIRLRNPEMGDQWHNVAPGTPGANAFLSIALTCISTGLPADAGIDDSLKEYSPLTRLEIVRE